MNTITVEELTASIKWENIFNDNEIDWKTIFIKPVISRRMVEKIYNPLF
jgi:hypothetical protein